MSARTTCAFLSSLFGLVSFAGACDPGETAIRAELQFDECLSADRVERITVVLESAETTVTRNLSRSSYRIRDGFAIRLVPADERPGDVTIQIALLNADGNPIASTDPIPATFEAGRVVPLDIAMRCLCNGLCGGPPQVCGSPEPCMDARCFPEVCGNFADEDCDALFDCCDPDCEGDPTCFGLMAPGLEVCFDGEDNDCNGLVDCDDFGCFGDPGCACRSPYEIDCFDGLDDDCDRYTDCADPDCGMSGCCVPTMPREATGFCGDVTDNDCDQLTDCCDPDCAESVACTGAGSRTESVDSMSCDNAADDDCDGLVDCCDDGCFTSERCAVLAEMVMPGAPPPFCSP
jgi:hypothetical protein